MNTKWLMVAIATCFLGFSSCNDKEDAKPSCSTAWSTELESELNAVISAASAYGNDPSPANCNTYKSSYQAYINALRPYGNCNALTGQARNDFNAALEQAEADLVNLCN